MFDQDNKYTGSYIITFIFIKSEAVMVSDLCFWIFFFYRSVSTFCAHNGFFSAFYSFTYTFVTVNYRKLSISRFFFFFFFLLYLIETKTN